MKTVKFLRIQEGIQHAYLVVSVSPSSVKSQLRWGEKLYMHLEVSNSEFI